MSGGIPLGHVPQRGVDKKVGIIVVGIAMCDVAVLRLEPPVTEYPPSQFPCAISEVRQ
jgi:hypothetical protein